MENEFLQYLLRSSLCLALFYLSYKWLLSRQPHHGLNRGILLGIYILSLAIPLLQRRAAMEIDVQQFFSQWVLPSGTPPLEVVGEVHYAYAFPWIWLFGGLYCAGICFFLLYFFYSHIQVLSLLRMCRKLNIENGAILALHSGDTPSFGWWNYLVISEKDIQEAGEMIVAHEQAHCSLLHSVDLLISAIFRIVFWFNPFVWLLQRELQIIHEYQADAEVLRRGMDMRNYQLLLIRKSVGVSQFSSAVNLLSHSKIKKRITMMLSPRSHPLKSVKYLLLIPLSALISWTCSRADTNNSQTKIVNWEVNHTGNIQHRSTDASWLPLINSEIGGISAHDPLYILNEKVVSGEQLNKIDSDKVGSVTVLKNKAAAILHGEEASHGAVIVKTENTLVE